MAELAGLIIGMVTVFGQAFCTFVDYRQHRRERREARKKSEALSQELETAGPVVKTEYDKGFEIFGEALACYKDKDIQIELLLHKTVFLEKVLLTLQAVIAKKDHNPLDYLTLQYHASTARAGVLCSLDKAVTNLSTVPQRQIAYTSGHQIILHPSIRHRERTDYNKVVYTDLRLSDICIGEDASGQQLLEMMQDRTGCFLKNGSILTYTQGSKGGLIDMEDSRVWFVKQNRSLKDLEVKNDNHVQFYCCLYIDSQARGAVGVTDFVRHVR